jgi:hypothetical protein
MGLRHIGILGKNSGPLPASKICLKGPWCGETEAQRVTLRLEIDEHKQQDN